MQRGQSLRQLGGTDTYEGASRLGLHRNVSSAEQPGDDGAGAGAGTGAGTGAPPANQVRMVVFFKALCVCETSNLPGTK